MAKLTLFEKLDRIEGRYDEMTSELSSAQAVTDTDRYQKLAKAHSDLGTIVAKYREWKDIHNALEGAKQLFAESSDAEMKQMAHDEQRELETRLVPVAGTKASAHPEGSQRRKKRDRRNPCRHGRRRSLALRSGTVPDVFALRGNARVEG
jgi:hypothetical protein